MEDIFMLKHVGYERKISILSDKARQKMISFLFLKQAFYLVYGSLGGV